MQVTLVLSVTVTLTDVLYKAVSKVLPAPITLLRRRDTAVVHVPRVCQVME